MKYSTFHIYQTLSFSQVGQTSASEVQKRDLRAELFLAEAEAKNKKRKAEGKPPLPIEGISASSEAQATVEGGGDEESNKRRKLLQEALDLDKDDDDDDEEEEEKKGEKVGDNGNASKKGAADERCVTHSI